MEVVQQASTLWLKVVQQASTLWLRITVCDGRSCRDLVHVCASSARTTGGDDAVDMCVVFVIVLLLCKQVLSEDATQLAS